MRGKKKVHCVWNNSVQDCHRCRSIPHGGVLVRRQQAVAGLHASDSHCPLPRLAGHKHWLLVRLLWNRNLLQGGKRKKNSLNMFTVLSLADILKLRAMFLHFLMSNKDQQKASSEARFIHSSALINLAGGAHGGVPSSKYLIRLHWRVLDHHALHLVAHIALLVASESEVGCWLHAHYCLVAGRWVWHHGLVHWGKMRKGTMLWPNEKRPLMGTLR